MPLIRISIKVEADSSFATRIVDVLVPGLLYLSEIEVIELTTEVSEGSLAGLTLDEWAEEVLAQSSR